MLDATRNNQMPPARIAKLVLENSADFAILTFDLDGIITSWNGAAEQVMGWSMAEALGQHASMIFTPEDREQGSCLKEMEEARNGSRAVDERWHLRKDNSRFWGAGSMTALLDEVTGEHLGYAKIVRDRTEQHLAGRQLRASEAVLRGLFENSADCLKLLSLDGRLTFMNGPGLRTLGIDNFDVVRGAHYPSLWPEAERAKVEAALAEAVAGRIGRFEGGGPPSPDGLPRWWDVQVTALPGADGKADLLLASSRDVTERERSREAVGQSEQRLRAALSISTVGIVFWNNDLTLTEVNDAFLRITGFTRDEVIGKSWRELTPTEFYDPSLKAVEEVTTTGETTAYEKQYYRKDGSRWWGLFAPRRIGDEVVEFILDVTARREAESELRRLNNDLEVEAEKRTQKIREQEEALRQSQKLEAMGQLTGGVAHDFNNLLTVIRSSADLLRRPDLTEERRRRYVDAIAETADRAAKVTGQLLSFARRQPLKPEIFAVSKRLQSVVDLIRPLVGGRVRVETVIGCEDCAVEADPNQFETALVNLAVNARDAMDGEGTLTLRTWIAPEMLALKGEEAISGPCVAVSVTDTGTGIAPELLDRVLEPFFTTKEVGKGTGLGLSQIYGFAKQSGGELQVESEVGRGTTFTLYLPMATFQPVLSFEHADPDETVFAADRRRVLLVEDNAQVGAFAKQMLEDIGYQPTWVPNAEAALEVLQEQPGEFDIVFSDVVMPGMNGVDLGREIRRLHPGLRVVLTSGYSHILSSGHAQEFDLLQKPYSPNGLVRLLSGRGAKHHDQGRQPSST